MSKRKVNCILATTRFNNETYNQYIRYKINNNITGCIYNVPKLISMNINTNDILHVVEMNNDTNTIMGIGIIQNKINYKKHKIYLDQNYNRYTYNGKYRISRQQLLCNEKSALLIKKLENNLFKGKSHLKRGQGITCIPKKFLFIDENNKNNNIYLEFIKNKLIEIFK
jgi:hypothetical protein